MTRFKILFIFSFLLFGIVHFSSAQEKPNIIFIVADDLGWGDVGFNGQTKINTPNIDQLAKEGIVFNNFYSGSTVCGPSRASLMTGKHMGHASVRGNPRWTASGKPADIRADEITIAEELKRAGYTTGIIGKWGLAENLDEGKPNKQGFDYFYGFNKHKPAHHYYPDSIWENDKKIVIEGNNWKLKKKHYVQDLFTEKAKNFIHKNNKIPFFLYLAYTVPHFELTVPEDSKKQYINKGWPLRKMKAAHYLHDKNGHVTYAAMVSRLDKQVGELMNQLKELGIEKNTLVIFTSDNGHAYDALNKEFFNSNGPYKGRKRDLYEGGIKIPFVAKWPEEIKPNTKSNHISAFWDVLPTFCDIARTEVRSDTDGITFLPALKGKKTQSKHKYLYWEFNEGKGPIQAIRMQQWKLVKRYQKDVELYNLDKDQGETINLAQQEVKVLDEMLKLLKTARTAHPEFPLLKLR
ncbi:MAG: arylsulfatase [Flavobacteriaceae bacterium]|nr:MAG: arylsulfatase [Flavobacteriaceae bacterium]